MKKLLAFFTLCLAFTSAYAHPQDGMSPEDLMRYYAKVFNEENIPALEEVYIASASVIGSTSLPAPRLPYSADGIESTN